MESFIANHYTAKASYVLGFSIWGSGYLPKSAELITYTGRKLRIEWQLIEVLDILKHIERQCPGVDRRPCQIPDFS